MINKMNELYGKLEDLEGDADNLHDAVVYLRRRYEELPSEVDEIEDDDPTEEKAVSEG